MKTELKRFSEISEPELAQWQQFVDADDAYSSPYFQPDFCRAVAAVRDDVHIAVIKNGQEIAGFFPLQIQGKTAFPVGGQLSDAHGVITREGKPFNWETFLKSCGLQAWVYHYHVERHSPKQHCYSQVTPSAIMNMEGGLEKYAGRLKSKNVIKQADRKCRKMERELGPVRFEWDCNNEAMLDLMMEWKSDQYRRSDIADVFQHQWTVGLLKEILKRPSDRLQGSLSVLYCDERPLAIHFGLRTGPVFHQWFPAFDCSPEIQPYSPGAIHLIEEARAACDHGVERIDLGKTCQYKSRIATDFQDVAEGRLDLQPLSRLARIGYRHTYEWLRDSRLKSVVKIPGRMIRRLVENRQFQ